MSGSGGRGQSHPPAEGHEAMEAASPLPELDQLPGLDVREADDLVSPERLLELRTKLARDARSRREAEATSATLRMG
jgi:hypothetical protein